MVIKIIDCEEQKGKGMKKSEQEPRRLLGHCQVNRHTHMVVPEEGEG